MSTLAPSRPATAPAGHLAAPGHPTPRTRPGGAAHLTDAEVDAIGAELDAVRQEVLDSRGERDRRYIRRVIRAQRGLELVGRVSLVLGRSRRAWALGVGAIAAAKVLENMEIGHNVIHGQWDWMRDKEIHSTTWEWDFVAPAAGWKHTHNDLHHTWTNVVGRDSDVGYHLLRVSPQQPWEPRHRTNVLKNALLAPFFEWGIAIYDLELPDVRSGAKSRAALLRDLRALGRKAAGQALKDYVATPLAAELVGGRGRRVLAGTFAANTLRNLWAHSVIFCGHFPDGVEAFDEAVVDGETRGDWYVRQMLGSANISGGPLVHLMTGNLSRQIEHHLFPDLPSNRYAQVAPRVRALCERYGLPYVEGPLHRQVASSWRIIARLARPDGEGHPAAAAPA